MEVPRTPILLVDDRRANLDALEAVFESQGYELVSVTSGQEALDEVECREFAVILLDLQMPTMDGVETARRIKERAGQMARRAPIIFVTAIDSDQARIRQAYDAGAVDFMQKPLEPHVLRAKVSVFAELYRSRHLASEATHKFESERRAAEEEARRFRLLVESVKDYAIFILDPKGHIATWNPLSALDMGAALVRQRATVLKDEALGRVGDRMKASTRRMTRMIEQILDLTRSRLAGGLEIKRENMDLGATIALIVDEIRAAHPLRRIDLRYPPTGIAKGAWDRDRLEQVFSNLVGNAVSHGDPAKPVTIEVREEDPNIVVTVHNEGPPIPEAVRAELFSPFRRGERDSKTMETLGLGLGLYISRELVVAHGGDIDVRSTSTDGTTFLLRLPRGLSAIRE